MKAAYPSFSFVYEARHQALHISQAGRYLIDVMQPYRTHQDIHYDTVTNRTTWQKTSVQQTSGNL